MELTQAQLKEKFTYDEHSGIFTNNKTGGEYRAIDERGYIRISIRGKRYRAHRLAFLYMTGRFPKNIDHINSVGNDNRWCNLRECEQAENCRNRKTPINSSSGIKNVVWDEASKRWSVVIRVDGERYDYGYFYDLEIAELVAIGARVKHHGGFAKIE